VEYIFDNPDLVVASHDADGIRRLFETRTRWPGTRYARLTIASVLSGDLSDAYRYAVQAEEWIHHSIRQNESSVRDQDRPERLDIASIPFCLIAQDRGPAAAQYLKTWKDWYAYEVSEHIFTLLNQTQRMGTVPTANIQNFLESLNSQSGVIAAALSFLQLSDSMSRRLVRELAKACDETKSFETSHGIHHERDYLIQDGLLKSVAIAVARKMLAEAHEIVEAFPKYRPNLSSFTDRLSNRDTYQFIIYTALRAAADGVPVTELMLLPQELLEDGKRVPHGTPSADFRKAIKLALNNSYSPQEPADQKRRVRHETKRDAINFIDERLGPLLEMTQALAAMLSAGVGKADRRFLDVVGLWTRLRKNTELYWDSPKINWFFDKLGLQIVTFALWARTDIKGSSAEVLTSELSQHSSTPTSRLIQIVAIFAQLPALQEEAGRLALCAKALIEQGDEVSSRASGFAQLSRAILPASVEETGSYFRLGLEQMDAIGSGDYQFTSELLAFAGSLHGEELQEPDFHTLSNIC
jgi:hypothetical protein